MSDQVSPRRIFIAGGTGYLGTGLIPQLIRRGHEVSALVRPESAQKLPTRLSAGDRKCYRPLYVWCRGERGRYICPAGGSSETLSLEGSSVPCHRSGLSARIFGDREDGCRESLRLCQRGAPRPHHEGLYRSADGMRSDDPARVVSGLPSCGPGIFWAPGIGGLSSCSPPIGS